MLQAATEPTWAADQRRRWQASPEELAAADQINDQAAHLFDQPPWDEDQTTGQQQWQEQMLQPHTEGEDVEGPQAATSQHDQLASSTDSQSPPEMSDALRQLMQQMQTEEEQEQQEKLQQQDNHTAAQHTGDDDVGASQPEVHAVSTSGNALDASEADDDDNTADTDTDLLAQIQAANEAVEQAAQTLDRLGLTGDRSTQDANMQESIGESTATAAAARPSVGQTPPSASSTSASPESQPQSRRRTDHAIGVSGIPAFLAAGKTLKSDTPSRTMLVGCLEAIDMQRQQAYQAIAAKQLKDFTSQVSPDSDAGTDSTSPYAKMIKQTMNDMQRFRCVMSACP